MTLAITKHTDDFSSCPQLTEADIPEVLALGFKTIINNRPDGEGGADQPLAHHLKQACEKVGIHYIHIPVIPGNITQDNVAACVGFITDAPKPILGFCKTGMRAGNLYKLASSQLA